MIYSKYITKTYFTDLYPTDKWVWNDTDVSDQPQQVQDICNTVWTDAVKADYKAKVIAQG